MLMLMLLLMHMYMQMIDEGSSSTLSNESIEVAPQRVKAGSQTLRLLGAVEAKSLWSCLWVNYTQVKTIKVDGR